MPLSMTFPIDYAAMASDVEREFVRVYAEDNVKLQLLRWGRTDDVTLRAFHAWEREHDADIAERPLTEFSDAALRALMARDVRSGARNISQTDSEQLIALESLLDHIDDDRLEGATFYEYDSRCGCLYGTLAAGEAFDHADSRGQTLAHRARRDAFGSSSIQSFTENLVRVVHPDNRYDARFFDPDDPAFDTPFARGTREDRVVKQRIVDLLRGVVVAAIDELDPDPAYRAAEPTTAASL